MGVLSGKDLYSSKWITADITDSSSKVHFVPIKHTIGNYFVCDIDGQIYCFKIEGSRIKTWEHSLAKSFRKIYYDTSHYLPISAGDTKLLADYLRKNNLPKMNRMLFNVTRHLGNKETQHKEFSPHDLNELIAEISEHQDKYSEQVRNITTFIKDLGVEKIVTPTRKIGEFIEDDLKATDPQFLGTVVSSFQRTDIEHKKITNTPLGVKGPWLKVILLLLIVGTIGFAIYYLWDTGAFEDISLPGIPGVESEADKLMSKYPTPEALRDAVDSGELEYNELPKDIKSMVDKIDKIPTATPKN